MSTKTNMKQTGRVEVAAKKTEIVAPAAPATDLPSEGTLKVKAGVKYRGARDSYYKRLTEFDNKPLSAFLESLKTSPPALLTARSKNAGQPEAPSGWIRFFVRNGVLTIQ